MHTNARGASPLTLSLSTLCLDPGKHEVASPAGLRLGFETVGFVRETPEMSGQWSIVDRAVAPHYAGESGAAVESATSQTRVSRASGALVTTVALPTVRDDDRFVLPPPRQDTGRDDRLRLLRSRVLPGRHALVLRDDGSLVEVFPTTENWLQEIDLHPYTVDVLRAVRDMSPRPAFFLEFSPRSGQCVAVEIPQETDLMPGLVKHRPADKWVSDVIAANWQLSSSDSAERRARLLSMLLRADGSARSEDRSPASKAPALHVRQGGNRGSADSRALRTDVLVDPEVANPYDDVLSWISERKSASVSMADFAEAWSWSCARHRMPGVADRYRQAISRLSDLGFVEPDWTRRRVCAAVPALVELPASNGLLLLVGARPPRLLERLEDDTDANPAVAEAASLWMIHRRLQLVDGIPAAPTGIYLEIDTAHASRMLEGLAALGVHVTTDPAPRLLSGLPTQTQLKACAIELAVSPGGETQRRRLSLDGSTDWHQTDVDRGPGLYRYRLAHGDRYAFRESAEAPLLAVERASGVWLDDLRQQATDEQLRRLVHQTGARTLDVSAQLGLPWPVRRALTLRTGLLPTVRQQPDSAVDRGKHTTYRNIDSDTAEAVGRVVGRAPL